MPRIIIFRDAVARSRARWQETSKVRLPAHKASKHTSQTHFLNGMSLRIKAAKVCPASWLTLGGGHDSTPGGDPEEQVPKIVQGLA
jgi:hypothetical protein